VTATLAGQIVMEGFCTCGCELGAAAGHARHRHRSVVIVTAFYGDVAPASAGVQPGRAVDAIAIRGDPLVHFVPIAARWAILQFAHHCGGGVDRRWRHRNADAKLLFDTLFWVRPDANGE